MTAIATRPAPLDVLDLPGGDPDLDWYGCYRGSAASKDPGLYTPQATRHAAKMSLLLLRRILAELVTREWLQWGDLVVDPFGGRGATGIEWCRLSPYNQAVCVDCEAHYLEMARACRTLAAQTYHWLPQNLRLLHGDSRRIDELLFQEQSYRVAVGSPPYEDSLSGDNPDKRGGLFRDPKRRSDPSLTANYLALGSPPFEAQSGGAGEKSRKGMIGDTGILDRHAASNSSGKDGTGYAENSPAQIGTKRGKEYQEMCLDVYRALARAGCKYAVLVVKCSVKNGALHRLDNLTIDLMEQAGYRLAFRKRAWLWETRAQMLARGVQPPPLEKVAEKTRANYVGREDQIPHGRLTFFHQIHLLAGRRAPAQWEDVLAFELEDR